MRQILLHIILITVALTGFAQRNVEVHVTPSGLSDVEVFLDNTDRSFLAEKSGVVLLKEISDGPHTITVFAEGYLAQMLQLDEGESKVEVSLAPMNIELNTLNVVDISRSGQGMSKLKYIEVDGLYAAKKNEIVLPEEMNVNRSTNNSRQVFSKVPGINVQETDAGGLQMGVGARGLDPKRTTNFNTRQDGYDISADALGYPESYYTPPIEAVERIELVRGAASLQYGTQFGGLLNFKMKRGAEDRRLAITQRTTLGSYEFFNSFTSIGGTAGEWNYYGFYQHKQGNGWRPNSHFVSNASYIQAGRKLGARWSLDVAYTHSFYNAKQPGGLTDRQFETDPHQSHRDRNWFRINWNVFSATLNGKLTETLTLNSKTFVLKSSRAALGFLGSISRVDTGGLRDLILGEFNNIGNETRLIQRFDLAGNPGAILVGTRLYHGDTRNRQGKASSGQGPDYNFLRSDELEGSDFRFPSENGALFGELLLPISSCWYLTPGFRLEHIRTRSEGYYSEINRHPLTQEILSSEVIDAETDRSRSIALFGLGATWRCNPDIEFYANASQNYRAMNFSDIYVSNPNLVVAQDMRDERGFTIDLGAKGTALKNALSFDLGVFIMDYNNRIGESLEALTNEQGVTRVVNYRDNIADARFLGVEMFEELKLSDWLMKDASWGLSWYNNIAIVEARYRSEEMTAFDGNRVENVPVLNFKTGLGFEKNAFQAGVQFNHVSDQYTDATNAEFFPDATVGLIPAYTVWDASLSYSLKMIRLEGSINNMLDNVYLTRRATGYPGPGIIPAERRMFFMTLQVGL